MTSVVMLIAAFLAGPSLAEPTRQDLDAATTAIANCYKVEAARLDDGTSNTDLIAAAVVRACASQIEAMDGIFKRTIIAITNASPGLSQPEKDKLALSLLADKPQKMRSMLEQNALLAVQLERSRKKSLNAAN